MLILSLSHACPYPIPRETNPGARTPASVRPGADLSLAQPPDTYIKNSILRKEEERK